MDIDAIVDIIVLVALGVNTIQVIILVAMYNFEEKGRRLNIMVSLGILFGLSNILVNSAIRDYGVRVRADGNEKMALQGMVLPLLVGWGIAVLVILYAIWYILQIFQRRKMSKTESDVEGFLEDYVIESLPNSRYYAVVQISYSIDQVSYNTKVNESTSSFETQDEVKEFISQKYIEQDIVITYKKSNPEKIRVRSVPPAASA